LLTWGSDWEPGHRFPGKRTKEEAKLTHEYCWIKTDRDAVQLE
jgi:hypothetical protein